MKFLWVPLCLAALVGTGCVVARHTVQLEPVTVDPIHLTVDVNIDVEGDGDKQPAEPAPAEEQEPPPELPAPYVD